jgi:acetyl-CoA carboxylase biotin carboxyl carrier protein
MTAIDNEVSTLPDDLVRQPSPFEVAATLDVVRESVLRLLSGFPHPPSALRINAGEVTVEAEWPFTEPGAAPAVLVSTAVAQAPAAAPPVADTRQLVSSPTVGVFYAAPEPGARPFVEAGSSITAGQQVGIVEAMKLMIPVKADGNGVVVEVLKGDGEVVEYGEPLLAYESR